MNEKPEQEMNEKQEPAITRQELAITRFGKGFNCAQSVLSVFCEKYGLEMETAMKLACGLGGGFRQGEICGAVSGAVLVIGLKDGQYIAEDAVSKANCYAKTDELIKRFKEKYSTIICRELIGVDISTEEGRKQALDKSLFRKICDDMVKNTIVILEEMGY